MARPRKTIIDATLLHAALEGLELQKARLDDQIREVRRMLGSSTPAKATKTSAPETKSAAPAPAPAAASKKRTLSAEARKRIAAAQKKRWANYHKGNAAKTAPVKTAAKSAAAKKD